MIELQNIYTEELDNKVYLKSDCLINGNKQILWFSTSAENAKYISTSNADAFILFIFIYAIWENVEFKSIVPISKRLKFGLLEVLLPAFQEMGFKSKVTQFSFEQEDETIYPEAKAVGTAMSFGVDSFFTFVQGIKSNLKLNHITLFNAGAFGNYGGKETEVLFNGMKQRAHEFAVQNNMGFVWIDTNMNEIFKIPFIQTHTFRNFSCVLVLQKLFKEYFYASSQTLDRFALKKSATGYYELLIVKAIKGNSLDFHISGLTEDRIEKTKMISANEITFRNLNVCLVTSDYEGASLRTTSQNCSKCFKCIRTMVTLDILGKLNQYQKVFDLTIYKKNKNKYLADLLYKKYRANDVFSKEIFTEAKNRNYPIPSVVYFLALMRLLQPIIGKIKKI